MASKMFNVLCLLNTVGSFDIVEEIKSTQNNTFRTQGVIPGPVKAVFVQKSNQNREAVMLKRFGTGGLNCVHGLAFAWYTGQIIRQQ